MASKPINSNILPLNIKIRPTQKYGFSCYDPTDMYPYKVEEPEESKIAIEDNSPIINPTYIKYNDAPNISKRMEYYIA